jgi:hypothetical protein
MPAVEPLLLVEPSSWSCAHGIERWRSGCACGNDPGASHAWRRPLRSALNWLGRELDALYVAGASREFGEPWAVRDAYGAVAALADPARDAFIRGRLAAGGESARARRLLDGARARLAMFSSCAWFFDRATGHEAVLMLRLAAYAIDRLGAHALEREFIERLALAADEPGSNRTAAAAYGAEVLPLRPLAQPAARQAG